MRLFAEGPLRDLSDAARRTLLDRRASFEPFLDAVAPLRADVRARGDAALVEITARFDKVRLDALEVPSSQRRAALQRLPGEVRDALATARASIERFHRPQLRPPAEIEVVPGLRAGRRFVPLQRVGVYVPGGRAAYPSTVLMATVPAKVARVPEVVVCTPPGPDGKVPDATLAACEVAGVDRVFSVGGAQAVFAMAYGTATIPRCDKIVGPGNAYVAAAKSLVAGDVAIDAPAGPSEVLVVHLASEPEARSRDARFAALELLAQAEHDPEAAVALVTTDPAFASDVRTGLETGLAASARADVVRAALATRGALLVAKDADEALAFAEAFAPEHLVLLAKEPRAVLDGLTAYGSAFLGPWSSVAFGDYDAGPNHVLPTAGLARSYSGLSVDDFLRRPTHQTATREGAARLAPVAETLATLEGLAHHADAARARREAPP